jgi:hypothetical protein
MQFNREEFKKKHENKQAKSLNMMIKGFAANDKMNFKQEKISALRELLDKNPCKDLEFAHKYIQKSQSAGDRGIDFSLTFSEYKKLLSRKTCAYTGATMNSLRESPNQRTLDRFDSSKGYISGNVYAVTVQANAVKNLLFEDPESKFRMSPNDAKSMIDTIFKLAKQAGKG